MEILDDTRHAYGDALKEVLPANYQSIRVIRRKKIIRDTELLRQYAAHVLVLDRDGRIVEEITHDPCDEYTIRTIAVLAPAKAEGKSFEEALVLEIGFSRTRPYTQTERRKNGKRYFFIKARRRVRAITWHEYALVQERIFEIMRGLVVRLRQEWKTQDAWRIGRKNVEYERGIFFSVHRSDESVLAHLLFADIRFRRKANYFLAQARRLVIKLSRYRNAYTDKQYQKLKGVQEALFLLEKLRHPAKYVRELIPTLPRPVHAHILRIAGMSPRSVLFDKSDEETQFLDRFSESAFVQVSGFGLCISRRHKRTFHAQDCVVAEGILAKQLRPDIPQLVDGVSDDVPF